MIKRRASLGPVRVLHSVGHLLRGGIEMWLYQTLTTQHSPQFEHHVLVRTADEEAFTAAFRASGIPVLVCPHFGNPVRYALDLRRLVSEHGPYDILHVHGSSFSGLLTLALAKQIGIPATIVHSHNDVLPHIINHGYFYRAYVAGVLKAYRALADHGFAASVLAAKSMFGAGWELDRRWQLLYYGVDLKPFAVPKDPALRGQLGIPHEAFVIGHVGRFHEQKNHDFIINVITELMAREPHVHCLLIGDGPLRGEITAAINRRNLQDHFTFVLDTLAVPAYMISVMDCFLFPSRYEGLGLVVVEAQAAGLACVISDRVPSEAIVNPALVRVLPLEKSAAEWADVALNSKKPWNTSAGDALKRVENSRFDLDRCVSILQRRYCEIVTATETTRLGSDQR